MAVQIQYFRDGKLLCETPLERPLAEAREFATSGLDRHTAEYAAILDEDGNLIETVKRRT